MARYSEGYVPPQPAQVGRRRRAVADHDSGGLGGLGVPAAAGMEDPQLLTELLAGIDPDWEKKLLKFDLRHWIGNFTAILADENGTQLFNLFMSLVADARFWLLPWARPRASGSTAKRSA